MIQTSALLWRHAHASCCILRGSTPHSSVWRILPYRDMYVRRWLETGQMVWQTENRSFLLVNQNCKAISLLLGGGKITCSFLHECAWALESFAWAICSPIQPDSWCLINKCRNLEWKYLGWPLFRMKLWRYFEVFYPLGNFCSCFCFQSVARSEQRFVLPVELRMPKAER